MERRDDAAADRRRRLAGGSVRGAPGPAAGGGLPHARLAARRRRRGAGRLGPGARPQATALLHGADAVARRAATFVLPVLRVHQALVNGAAGAVLSHQGRPVALLGFTVVAGRIAEIDAITDPDRLSRLDLPVLDS